MKKMKIYHFYLIGIKEPKMTNSLKEIRRNSIAGRVDLVAQQLYYTLS